MGFKTPSYGEILDTYIAYGFVESLLRAGIEELTLIPQGGEYIIEVNASKNTLLTG
ncbi:MAG TPA: type I-A CRISPR-associated protein Cas8a2/Csa4, partial [Thermococcus paralvinellae]|nr:type I-A CRISPR-associated protein Cas8a2/Csa4 [Thermococcus paralvinellae]